MRDPEAVEAHPVLLFQTTTHVLWAEEVAQEKGIPVEVVPAPRRATDICGLALRTLESRVEDLIRLLEEEGISFKRHS